MSISERLQATPAGALVPSPLTPPWGEGDQRPYLSIARKFLLIRLPSKKTACVVDDAVNARNRGERNFVQRLNLDWPVAVHEPKAGENVVNVVNPVRGNHNTVGLGLNAARRIADDEPNRRRAVGQIDDGEC